MNTDISHLELELRRCACGCGAQFRTLTSSPQRFAVSWCAEREKVFDVGLMRKVRPEERERLVASRKVARASGKAVIAQVKARAA